jgi:hypothetical protein
MKSSYSKTGLTAVILWVAVVLVPVSGLGQSDLDGFTRTHDELSDRLEQLGKRIRDREKAHRQLTDKISTLKAQELSIQRRNRLQTLLKKSHQQAETLRQLQQKRNRLGKRIQEVEERIDTAVSRRIVSLRSRLRRNAYPDVDRVLTRIEELEDVRRKYVGQSNSARKMPFLKEDGGTRPKTPEEWHLAADKMRDVESNLKEYLNKLKDNIDSLETQRMVRKRARRFGREDRFFDEGSRVSPLIRRQSSDSSSGDPTAAPESQSDSAAAENTDDGGTASTEEPTVGTDASRSGSETPGNSAGDEAKSPSPTASRDMQESAGGGSASPPSNAGDSGGAKTGASAEFEGDSETGATTGARSPSGTDSSPGTTNPTETGQEPSTTEPAPNLQKVVGGDGTNLQLIDTLGEERLFTLPSREWESLSVEQKLKLLKKRKKALKKQIEKYQNKASTYEKKARSPSPAR